MKESHVQKLFETYEPMYKMDVFFSKVKEHFNERAMPIHEFDFLRENVIGESFYVMRDSEETQSVLKHPLRITIDKCREQEERIIYTLFYVQIGGSVYEYAGDLNNAFHAQNQFSFYLA